MHVEVNYNKRRCMCVTYDTINLISPRWFSLAAMRESVKMALNNQVSFAVSHINKVCN